MKEVKISNYSTLTFIFIEFHKESYDFLNLNFIIEFYLLIYFFILTD